MEISAAVTKTKGAPFSIETVDLETPKEHEVLVRIVASGICHTDLSIRDQFKPVPLPVVLGHEGAGIVEAVGSGVNRVQPGAHVVLSYTSCGTCNNCEAGQPYLCEEMYRLNFKGEMPDGTCRLSQEGKRISTFFGQSSFATYAVVPEQNIVRVDNDLDLKCLAPLGCGVQTGSGAVFNRLQPRKDSSLAVFGCGTVGLSAIMAAKVCECGPIIAVDVNPERLELAKSLGATHAIDPTISDVVLQMTDIVNGGVDYSIDSVGNPGVLRNCLGVLRMGGTSLLIGGTPLGTEVSIDMNQLLFGRTIAGIVEGDSVPNVFIPKLIELYRSGDFPLDKLIQFYDFHSINEAVEDMETGRTVKPVLVF